MGFPFPTVNESLQEPQDGTLTMLDPLARRTHRRTLVLGVVAALSLSSCGALQDDGARSAADDLARGLHSEDVSGLAFSNGTGEEVQTELERVLRTTGGIEPDVTVTGTEVEGDTARAELSWRWDLPATDEDWTYTTDVDLIRADGGWRSTWQPSVVEPGLNGNEGLRIRTVQPQRGEILGADDVPLAMSQPVHRVGLDLRKVPAAQRSDAATALAKAVDIDAGTYRKAVSQASDDAWVEAVTLREEDFRALDAAQMKKIPGMQATEDTRVLGRSKGFAAETIGSVVEATAEDLENSDGALTRGAWIGRGGLQQEHEASLRGAPGVVVDRVGTNPDGSLEPGQVHQLVAHAPRAGEDLHTTLDATLQEAAQRALEDVDSPSSVVLVRPSDGAVLAVANGAGSKGYPTATLGQYAPGSTFKIATSLAMLRKGDSPDTTVDCPHTYAAEGTSVANFSGYPQQFEGRVPLRQAIAHSCNTAFAAQHGRVSQQNLAEAAESLGVGVDMTPGIPVFSGSIPSEEPAGEHVAAMFGQGRTLVSPFGMARFVASVQAGKLVQPTLLAGDEGAGSESAGDDEADDAAAAPAPRVPLTAGESSGLHTLMREVVASGHLEDLGSLSPDTAVGKTGTAEYGNEDPPRTHSWVIAGHEDLAAAVFVEDGNLGSITGTPIMLDVLRAAQGS